MNSHINYNTDVRKLKKSRNKNSGITISHQNIQGYEGKELQVSLNV